MHSTDVLKKCSFKNVRQVSTSSCSNVQNVSRKWKRKERKTNKLQRDGPDTALSWVYTQKNRCVKLWQWSHCCRCFRSCAGNKAVIFVALVYTNGVLSYVTALQRVCLSSSPFVHPFQEPWQWSSRDVVGLPQILFSIETSLFYFIFT